MMPVPLGRICFGHLWILTSFLLVACCSSGHLSVPGISFFRFPVLMTFEPWPEPGGPFRPTAQVWSPRPDTVLSPGELLSLLASLPYSLHSCFPSASYALQSPTLFKSLLSSPPYCLQLSTVFTPLLSAHLYSLHICALFTSLLSSLLFSLHFSSLFTSQLSSHLSSLHMLSPHALFTSHLSSHRSLYTQKLLTQQSFYTQKLLHREAF